MNIIMARTYHLAKIHPLNLIAQMKLISLLKIIKQVKRLLTKDEENKNKNTTQGC